MHRPLYFQNYRSQVFHLLLHFVNYFINRRGQWSTNTKVTLVSSKWATIQKLFLQILWWIHKSKRYILRNIISGPVASQLCGFFYWNAFICFIISCVKRTECQSFTHSVRAAMWKCMSSIAGSHLVQWLAECYSQLARTPQAAEARRKGTLTDTHLVWILVRVQRALIGLNGPSLQRSHSWPWPWTQQVHWSSVLVWTIVQVWLFPVLPSGWTLAMTYVIVCLQPYLWPIGLWTRIVSSLFSVLSLSVSPFILCGLPGWMLDLVYHLPFLGFLLDLVSSSWLWHHGQIL